MAEKKTVLAKARAWATKKKLFGAQAFFRYVILSFIESLNYVSDDFVFKGGNLLWVYIGTPRATIDLDLVTLKSNSHEMVRDALTAACAVRGDIRFSLISFKEVEQEGKSGCIATISYTTDQGATNRFDIDVVYAISTDSHEIASPVHEAQKIRAATVENIIADKLAACHRYRSGNTRMKDYDDCPVRAGVTVNGSISKIGSRSAWLVLVPVFSSSICSVLSSFFSSLCECLPPLMMN
jgi:hypothetical protein